MALAVTNKATNSLEAPKYLQIKDFIVNEIESGRLKPGDRLSSENELSIRFKVNKNTVVKSFRELELKGLICRFQGKGTFVSEKPKISTTNIGLILYHAEEPFYSKIVRGVVAKAMERGYHLILCNTNGSTDKEEEYVAELIGKKKVDGFLFCPFDQHLQSNSMKLLEAAGMPFVIFPQADLEKAGQMDYVICDDRQGAYQAVGHLAGHGHRKIGFLSQAIGDNIALNNRLNAYRQALKEAGIAFNERMLLIAGNCRQEDGFRKAAEVLCRCRSHVRY